MLWLITCSKTSGVDGRPLDGARSVKVQQDVDFESDGHAIRCTEVKKNLYWHDGGFIWHSVNLDVWPELNFSAGVVPAEGSWLQPGVCALVLQRVSEGDCFGHLQHSDTSPVCSYLQRHQLSLTSRLNSGWHGKNEILPNLWIQLHSKQHQSTETRLS